MTTCTRRFTFDAAHRVMGHEGKCRHLHGHTYVAEVTVTADINDLGMVVDFAVLKHKVGEWIDLNWDHNTILHPRDQLVKLGEAMVSGGVWKNKFAHFDDRRPFLMPEGMNPTAENMAYVLFLEAQYVLGDKLRIVRVRIQETPNCLAEYTPTKHRPDNTDGGNPG
jgi:6-pyruvoyltetrahydropterin/6-carboxytetrahydropterin synthase